MFIIYQHCIELHAKQLIYCLVRIYYPSHFPLLVCFHISSYMCTFVIETVLWIARERIAVAGGIAPLLLCTVLLFISIIHKSAYQIVCSAKRSILDGCKTSVPLFAFFVVWHWRSITRRSSRYSAYLPGPDQGWHRPWALRNRIGPFHLSPVSALVLVQYIDSLVLISYDA